MGANEFSEVSKQSWMGRLGNAFKGIIVGVFLVIGSIVFLFWNEGRSAKEISTLLEAQKAVISITANDLSSNIDGKLVYLQAKALTEEKLKDPQFYIEENAIKLKRVVEMYQWHETKKSQSSKELGGAKETRVTYSYKKIWTSELINSDDFKSLEGHQNPSSMPFSSKEFVAQHVSVGSFYLSEGLKSKLNNYLDLEYENRFQMPLEFEGKATSNNREFYFGKNSDSPEIGDMRVRFKVIRPGDVSLISKLNGQSFEPYISKVGVAFEMIQGGNVSMNEMFKKAETENKIYTWLFRLGGFMLMFFGFIFILNPISVLADIVPIFGDIAQAGIAFISFLVSISLSLCVIAFAWFFYRPILALVLIAVSIFAVFLIKHKLKK